LRNVLNRDEIDGGAVVCKHDARALSPALSSISLASKKNGVICQAVMAYNDTVRVRSVA
jgi:hypothetical protein